MESVHLDARRVADYSEAAGPQAVAELRDLSRELQGLRVLHVNSTPDGGGVAEMLTTIVPLLRDLGLDCQWQTIQAPPEFYATTKLLHNMLQGAEGTIGSDQATLWEELQSANAAQLEDGWDAIVVHDPQPVGLAALARSKARWAWRLHIDTSRSNPHAWALLRPYLDAYEVLIFTLPDFVPRDVPAERVRILAPAIDPLSRKNAPTSMASALAVLRDLGIDMARPLVSQVARLDPWKDPVGVIDAYRLVRREVPGLQLALLGAMSAGDDPEAVQVAADVRRHAADDADIHIYTDPSIIGPAQVGSVQLLSQVVLQKSLREGFGLTVSEALWKATPVVAGAAGGIPLQVDDGREGFLVRSVEEAAEHTTFLLGNPVEGRVMGARGRARVRDRFLVTRAVRDELTLYRDLVANRTRSVTSAA